MKTSKIFHKYKNLFDEYFQLKNTQITLLFDDILSMEPYNISDEISSSKDNLAPVQA